ncbi:MAG TPA: helix-turn-helix domain-containing protein [Candidatus Ventricola intestinavium]|nr:helix-turn-helix domain-containing protein [Candidatus Ventricola intestinavium]
MNAWRGVIPLEFGDILRQLRVERGLSQDELAQLLGTTKQVISRYETKKRVPRLSVVTQYAQKLNLPLSALTGEVPFLPPNAVAVGRRRRVPILGSAACGEPIYKPEDGTEFVSVEEDLPCDFALIAQGDSMTGDRIHSGDIVFIRSQDTVLDGEIAAVALDDEVTLKHVRRLRGADGRVVFTQLLPSNPAFSPIDIGGDAETRCVRILGKAVAVRFML